MKSIWEDYPATYRQKEITEIIQAVQAGASVSLIGLSGSGKSNLLGFLAHRASSTVEIFLVDGNRASQTDNTNAFFKLISKTLGENQVQEDVLEQLHKALTHRLEDQSSSICLIIDRYDAFQNPQAQVLASQLRYLRDTFKYRLTYVLGTRDPLDYETEIAELCYAHTIILGPLTPEDARWSIQSFAERNQLPWNEQVVNTILQASGAYPSFLRAACEAVAAGCPVNTDTLRNYPAVQHRLDEFLLSKPSDELLQKCGLVNHPWLKENQTIVDSHQLTTQEYRLLSSLQAHPGVLCSKDELIQAIWSEDKIYGQGLRDDSLAQLVRRLREKIETDPSNPKKIQTVIGRGYIYKDME